MRRLVQQAVSSLHTKLALLWHAQPGCLLSLSWYANTLVLYANHTCVGSCLRMCVFVISGVLP